MSPQRPKPLANVVSLDEFRQRVQPSQPDELPPTEADFTPVDYTTFHIARTMVSGVIGEVPAEDFGVVQKVTGKPRNISYTNEDGCWIAVEQNRDDIESLTLELENADEATELRLRTPIERLYLLSLIASRILLTERRINLRSQLQNPMAGDNEINVTDDRRQQSEVNNWRMAAGLAIAAVGRKRPVLRYQIRQHLNNVLAGRLQYLQSLGSLSAILGIQTPEMTADEPQVSNYLIGICNPLNSFELREMILPAKKP